MRRMPDEKTRDELRKKLNESREAAEKRTSEEDFTAAGAPPGWKPGREGAYVPDWWDDDPWDAPPGFEL